MKNFKRYIGLIFVFLPIALLSVASCGEGVFTYIELDGGAGGASPDAGTDGDEEEGGPTSSGGPIDCDFTCRDDCVPLHPGDMSFPVLVWIGPNDGAAPPCPDNAPVEQFVWHADLVIPPKKCGPCTCTPSTGTCALPSSITAHAAPCTLAEEATATPADPPAGWDGACAAGDALPADLSCGPEGPCVQSITVGPLGIAAESCEALDGSGAVTAPAPAPSWGLVARVCEGSAFGACASDEHCVPTAPTGFRQCVQREGLHDCAAEGYSEQFTFYEGFSDERVCTACSCGAPEGSYCHSDIAFYSDAACTLTPLIASAWSKGPTCHDVVPAGRAIGSKTALSPVYQPGSCQAAGGEVVGEVAKIGPRTVCCYVA
ncbi:hypothetical protein [Polyangium jinanense]|uniref:Uncharacterized protein n=1 Tax=Polyangium jinanense TaxID=2829994 RepID=A0A9X3WXL9_9BACT|nr:hypothetical protein [Polyangium jinanense]MDC3979982.1 hypothetical protein [Polyangium jinanense]